MQDVEWDFSWKVPTEAQLQALEYAYLAITGKPAPVLPKGITHHMYVMMKSNGRALAVDADIFSAPVFQSDAYDYAELILSANRSLWYTQICSWAKENPPFASKVPHWQKACQFIKEVVDLGYNPETKKWWDVSQLAYTTGRLSLYTVFALDLKLMMNQLRHNSTGIYSRGIEMAVDLIANKKALREVRKAIKDGKLKRNP